MARLLETTLRNGEQAVFEVCLAFDGGLFERALIGLSFVLACMPYEQRALGPRADAEPLIAGGNAKAVDLLDRVKRIDEHT